MFDHVQIKVSDLQKSRRFYEAVLSQLGFSVVFSGEGVVGIGNSEHDMFEVRQADNDAPLSAAIHVAFKAGSKESVDKFYITACALGARDNGSPGFREEYETGY